MIRLGVIGCGGVTEGRHLPALARVEGIEPVAVADTDGARAERLAQRFRIEERYTDYREMLRRARLDAVAVCLPPQFHAEAALAALKSGKHLFIEKPLALNLSDCDSLSECAATHSALRVMVGFNLRWHSLLLEAREVVRAGELGRVKLARTIFTSGTRLRDDFAEWRRQPETGGGALFELGMHHFDLMRFMLGQEVAAVSAAESASGCETATVTLHLDGGAQALCAFSEGAAENHELEIYGERGWLRVSCYRADGLERFEAGEYAGAPGTRLRSLAKRFLDLPRMVSQARRGGVYLASYGSEWRHFVQAVSERSAVESTLEDGRRALEIALAARQSSCRKRVVELSEVEEGGKGTLGEST